MPRVLMDASRCNRDAREQGDGQYGGADVRRNSGHVRPTGAGPDGQSQPNGGGRAAPFLQMRRFHG
eukprot:6439918-Lingulodinium_polyedra.AAC.1